MPFVEEIRDFCITHNATIITEAPEDIQVSHFAHYEDGEPGTISLIRYEHVAPCSATILLFQKQYPHHSSASQLLVQHAHTRTLVAEITQTFFPQQPQPSISTSARIHPTAIVNMEGQNYAQTADGWIDLPSAGSVTIADDVHVGAYATIVRGTAGNTTLHKGCRIGHHVNIGHDCRIGEHTLVIAHASLAGWVRVGRWCKIYQRACVKNGVTIGDGAIIGMGAVVTKDVGAGEIWAGNPARKIGYVRP